MLHMLLQWLFKCFKVFLQVFQTHVSSVSSGFKYMLQMFHLIVSKVDHVLLLGTHLPQQASRQGKSRGREHTPSGVRRSGDVQTGMTPTWARKTECRHDHPDARIRSDVRTLALPLKSKE
jgi:hypothetical protein